MASKFQMIIFLARRFGLGSALSIPRVTLWGINGERLDGTSAGEKAMDIVGIDPTTSRMRTTRSTTEPNALTDERPVENDQ